MSFCNELVKVFDGSGLHPSCTIDDFYIVSDVSILAARFAFQMPILDAHLSSRRTCEVLRFVQPSCPKISDMDQLVQLSCKACTTHTTCPRYSCIPALTAGGCDPPSLSLFLNLKTSISQLVTCQPPRQIPGSLLRAFARRGENRRRRVSVKAVLSSEERIGQKISKVSRRAASLPVIGCAECRRICSEGEPSLDLRLERLHDVKWLDLGYCSGT